MRRAVFLTALAIAAPASAQERRLEWPEAFRVETAAVIRRHGFACPEVKEAWAVQRTIRGDNARVVCGPVGGDPDPLLTFRMTSNGERGTVEPWVP